MSNNILRTVDNHKEPIVDENSIENLRQMASSSIEDLTSENGGNILIYPQSFGIYGDNIEKNYIFDIEESKKILITNNVMGFVGFKGTSVSISSRFTNDNGKDYFLHYLLQKVFSINIFDLDYTSDNKEHIFDILLFSFPHFLNKAMRQGLYKEYKTMHYNDSSIRGRIDINRYIRYDIPFQGKIAYGTREFAFDNNITELIRHTIEFIKVKDLGQNILSINSETVDNVRLIQQVTLNYSKSQRREVIAANIRPISHPYFSEYRDLQKICLMILRYEELKYGNDNNKIHGILFDGAWLWEEYLNTILKSLKFKHPKNKEHTGRLHLFQKEEGKKNRSCYPDFYKNDIVLDAKYKKYENKSVAEINREDLFQIISYMWVLKAHIGGIIFPVKVKDSFSESRKLMGYNGQISTFGLKVNSTAKTYKDFCAYMQREEIGLVKQIESINKQE